MMNFKEQKMKIVIYILLIIMILLSGCAAGAATAGYSLRAKTADELSPAAEHRITEQIKAEVLKELEK
jgi:PBP1b-binding outer membrane lipoprotein LpoB